MKNKKYLWLVYLSTILGASTIVFLCLFLSFLVTARTYETQLENTYMKNFYDMVSNVNDLEVDMSKIIATTSIDSQRTLLGNIYENSLLGVNNINLLPVNGNKMKNINKLLNSTSGFAYSLLLASQEGKTISTSDLEQISSLHTRIKEIQYDLNSYLSKLKYDYSILDDVEFDDGEASEFNAGLINKESETKEVPTLIYDGPFSDSVLNKEIKGLENVEYSLDQVEEKLSQLFTGFPINYIGETLGKFETYNFEVLGDISLYVSVTKKGGFLLSITSFGSGENSNLDLNDGIDLAETFASDMGIDNMYSVWHQMVGNILYVNLAPIENHVIFYSDLIKVKVDLSLGLVVGWEATNYATNHIDRDFTSSISLIEAQEKISPLLEIKERNLTIIPDKYVGEISAYEFICTWKEYTYYIR